MSGILSAKAHNSKFSRGLALKQFESLLKFVDYFAGNKRKEKKGKFSSDLFKFFCANFLVLLSLFLFFFSFFVTILCFEIESDE